MSAVPSIAPEGDSVAVGLAAQGIDTLREVNAILEALHVGEDRLDQKTTAQLLFAAQSLIQHEVTRLEGVYMVELRSAVKRPNVSGQEAGGISDFVACVRRRRLQNVVRLAKERDAAERKRARAAAKPTKPARGGASKRKAPEGTP
jgi:hypothetical protein